MMTDPENSLREVRLVDPAFNLDSFMKNAQEVFFSVKKALWAADPAGIALHLSEPALGKISFHAQRLKDLHQFKIVEGFELIEQSLFGAPDYVPGAELGVRFHYKTQSETLIGHDGQPIRTEPASHYKEMWVFHRRQDAATDFATLPQRCPHCSAPLDLQAGVCRFCKNPVRSQAGRWSVIKLMST